ncbi:hypothetical protein NIES2135_55270 [Leptolyngbya boryana NIES-2135]|jgi:uncharacterized membrane protein|uniref:Uncharacterized protein n=1 Tax=Leptolyngbya boryana NIES-2135 TaxID=1973484 RepID=A0A1Z4JPK7_LEPBY|nr:MULTISPECIES: hypothetical protein [Leptolyngbya]BAY58654.1 hypothetical protein NIES2135_55270 [Leptolyngbya boryana NIES-2135]MBD1856345.1 hypothetical protein [Leptolyngbya sp. FACHB-1624]MBD2371042.1 hypothetical protein [Leptolyngbya sp. FACHB-161]MBD2377236.1 hypothetical protein [Leptolyngbya sp. FACHB-238]MBD2401964.1 hypothetical protein [Leptolyngbya sp. FACHB-239]
MKSWLWCVAFVGMASVVSLSAIAKTPAPTSANSAREFIVRGNEPFWNITIGKKGIVYTTPDTKPRTFPYVAPIGAQGRPIDNVRVYRLQGNNILVLKKVDSCSDTMSDKNYPYAATLMMGNTVREGCAEPK